VPAVAVLPVVALNKVEFTCYHFLNTAVIAYYTLLSVAPKLPRVRLKSLAIIVLAFTVTEILFIVTIVIAEPTVVVPKLIIPSNKDSHIKLNNKNYKI